jgi:DeoR/GlpR family transcriptional regulator of sugar metabolism
MQYFEQLTHNRSRRLTGARNSQVIVPGCLSTMNQVERLRYIQDALSRQDFVSLEDLCAGLDVSRATVRRDLIELERSQNIRRVHGGAMSTSSREEALDFRRLSVSCQEEKMSIGRTAADLIQDGQTVILGGGSTVAEVARCLLSRPIQIITNSIPVAMVFWECKQTEVTLTGGYLYPRLGIQFGPICERMLQSISADVAILGIRGITADGLSDTSALVVESIRAMMKCAQQVVIVADHTKFGRNAMIHVADLAELDQIISDSDLAPEHRQLLDERGVSYLLA